MKSLGLGDVEDFPFLDPPQSKAITEGYRVLEELAPLDVPWPARHPDMASLGIASLANAGKFSFAVPTPCCRKNFLKAKA